MKPIECEFEADVLSAVLQSRWPDRVDAALLAHVPACAICSDVAAVAAAIDLTAEEMRASAIVPDSGRVWWLAQHRARREATRTAGRPITVAQVLAFACSMGLLGACFGATSTWFQSTLRWFGTSVARVDVSATAALLAEHGVLTAAAAGMLLLVPAAIYFVVVRD